MHALTLRWTRADLFATGVLLNKREKRVPTPGYSGFQSPFPCPFRCNNLAWHRRTVNRAVWWSTFIRNPRAGQLALPKVTGADVILPTRHLPQVSVDQVSGLAAVVQVKRMFPRSNIRVKEAEQVFRRFLEALESTVEEWQTLVEGRIRRAD